MLFQPALCVIEGEEGILLLAPVRRPCCLELLCCQVIPRFPKLRPKPSETGSRCDEMPAGFLSKHTAGRWDGHGGNWSGARFGPARASSHSMRAGSSGVFTLMAAWQAIEAAMRVRAASRFSACSGLPACSSTSTSMRSRAGAFEPGGRRLDGDGAGPERLHLKAIGLQFPGDGGKGDHLRRQQIEQHGHEQPLALYLLHPALAQYPLEQHPLVGHMLIDDPQALLVHRQDEGFAQLPQRPQRGQAVQGGAGAGFDTLPPPGFASGRPRRSPAKRRWCARWRRLAIRWGAPQARREERRAEGSTGGGAKVKSSPAGSSRPIAGQPAVGGGRFRLLPGSGDLGPDGARRREPAPA